MKFIKAGFSVVSLQIIYLKWANIVLSSMHDFLKCFMLNLWFLYVVDSAYTLLPQYNALFRVQVGVQRFK